MEEIEDKKSEWPSSKNPPTVNPGKDVERWESSCTVSLNVNWYNHYRGQYGASLRN